MHYNTSYGCGKCLKQAFVSSSALHTHKKVCLGLPTRKATGVLDGKPSSGGGDSSHRGSSKDTPKKNGKAATTNSQGSSAAPASQSFPCHSGRGLPTTTSLTRRKPAKGIKRWVMRARPGRAPGTRLARMGLPLSRHSADIHRPAVLSNKNFVTELTCLL